MIRKATLYTLIHEQLLIEHLLYPGLESDPVEMTTSLQSQSLLSSGTGR